MVRTTLRDSGPGTHARYTYGIRDEGPLVTEDYEEFPEKIIINKKHTRALVLTHTPVCVCVCVYWSV